MNRQLLDRILPPSVDAKEVEMAVVDVWESEEACRRFGEALGPVLPEVGVEDSPKVYPAHTFVSG